MRNLTKPLIHKLVKEKKITQLYSCYYTLPKSIPFLGINLGGVFISNSSPIEVVWYHFDNSLILYISFSSFEKSFPFSVSKTALQNLESTAKSKVKFLNPKFRNIKKLGNSYINYKEINNIISGLVKLVKDDRSSDKKKFNINKENNDKE